MMAADSAGSTLTTIVTCEGDLDDPKFQRNFDSVLNKLEGILGESLKVHKLEPWNSVRVTLSIPKEAALRLRQLANDGSQQLRALGILSVQVEGDQVISLRLAGTTSSEPQEIVLRTGQQDGSSNSTSNNYSTSVDAAVASEKVQFRSPNVVCPSDSIVPKVPVQSATNNTTPPTSKTYAGPFPFTSMNQAMHTSRDITNNSTNNNGNFTVPPPPYPGKHPPVTISSPLLVNLLQNEGASTPRAAAAAINHTDEPTNIQAAQPTPPPPPQQQQRNFVVNKQTVRCIATTTTPPNLQQHPKVLQQPPMIRPPLQTQTPQPQPTQQQIVNKSTTFTPNNLQTRNSVPYNMYPPPYPNTTVATAPVSATTTPQTTRPSTLQQQQQHQQQQQQQQQQPPPQTQSWEQTIQPMPQLQELTPSLTDLKTDLDHLIPTLERELAGSPPDLPDDLLNEKTRTVYLINPLTGELEPQTHSEEEEEGFRDVFTGLPSPTSFSDEDTNSTIRPDTTDQSDSESRSCHSDSSKHSKLKGRSRESKGRDSPSTGKPEKIKLRLKLEKSEPVSPAYKVDVSFINAQQPKKALSGGGAGGANSCASAPTTGGGEELRVPPLHISLRGRNHVVINNKKKVKLNPDGTPVIKAKPKKMQDQFGGKFKKESAGEDLLSGDEIRKLKKPKLNHENKEKGGLALTDVDKDLSLYNHLHYKDKLKERRGSDSELTRNNKKHVESNGLLCGEDRKRRLSQSEESFEQDTTASSILGSTNTGTVAALANHKGGRKEKTKLKENFKNKDLNRFKSYSKNIHDKLQTKQVTLPTGEIDMEAKFKQRLMEEPRIPHHRPPSEVVAKEITTSVDEKVEDLIEALADPPALKDKPPEPDKCTTPDRKPDIQDKQPNRSPNSGAQGEDSGIESMDALSEKSPNQASQSPHAEITDPLKNKNQVPDILDIEAQLAKMEGLHNEDLNENNHNSQTKLEKCCVLTSALQDSLNKGTVTLTQHTTQVIKEQMPQVEVSLVPIKAKSNKEGCKEEVDLEPLPVRVTPPLYTYSNPEKRGSESPTLSDSDSNLCNPIRKSLLEQLLIEIPENQTPSSPSPATRSVRTRASSKLNSPELSSPVVANNKNRTTPTTKRKRNESDSSNNSLEDQRNKKHRKCSENAVELIKVCLESSANKTAATTTTTTTSTTKKKIMEESSDSDEPLIEVAGKVRKNNTQGTNNGVTTTTTTMATSAPAAVATGGGAGAGTGAGATAVTTTNTAGVNAATTNATTNATTGPATARVKLKSNNATLNSANNPTDGAVKLTSVNTRRSIRTMPVINTRSKGDKSNPASDIIRRKTRSAVSEGEGKRRKDIK